MKLLTRFVLTLLPIVYMAFIWLQSSYFDPESLSTLSSQIPFEMILFLGIILELSHLFEFGVLYFLFIMAFLSYGRLTYFKSFLGVLLAFLYGFVDELHQMYVPYRSASIVDLVKNTIGIVIFWGLIHTNYYTRPHSKLRRAMNKITQNTRSG
ncbi:VanZ family protein [Bacillus sp. ISL-37]|uniref:VanZ family protein n=1 Tax=Bacillus sp. ISL-37 TaxID=2819123 RepID=UPI001BE8BE24|nr:VanZ family protein [Bacillus sp. ISL-37]MBT2686225.1 VanZ family protein [Bacillus sp. ISL-37]